ncbi:MAG: isochorismatase family cysteine hydrolase [Candidatus Acidiferrales bacterium]|jgi:ureidoacrylate peracid hydrolase
MEDVFSAHRTDDSIRLDAARTAVLVVDMLNDFCKEGGEMVLPGCDRLFPPQKSVISAARERKIPVIWVMDNHRQGLRRDREWLKRAPHCVEGTWGAEIVEELAPKNNEMRIKKHRYSGFFQTDLDLVLKDLECDQLVIFGVVTNICVRSTVHDAFFNGYTVVVPEDCCAATSPRERASSLYDIATHFGIVSDAASVVAALTTGAPLANKHFM